MVSGGERPASDAELVDRCRQGDPEAFRTLYERHAGRLYALARRLLGNATEAEDRLQEVFLQAYRRLATFRGDSSLGTWLHRLTVNVCVDCLRRRSARWDRLAAPIGERRMEPESGDSAELVVTRLDLERAIAELPPACRAAFVLHDVEGYEHREVAAMLGIAEGTSKSHVHDARLRLRARFRGGRGKEPRTGA